MCNRLIVTMTGDDRAGLLAGITTALAELGGDLKCASQTVVHSLFTMTVVVEFPDHRSPEVVKDHLLTMGRPYQLEVLIRESDETELDSPLESPEERYFLTITGYDAPGLMRGICALLARELITITDLFALPDSDSTFVMVMQLLIPSDVSADQVQAELDTFGSLNNITTSLQHEDDLDVADLPTNSPLSLLVKRTLPN